MYPFPKSKLYLEHNKMMYPLNVTRTATAGHNVVEYFAKKFQSNKARKNRSDLLLTYLKKWVIEHTHVFDSISSFLLCYSTLSSGKKWNGNKDMILMRLV